MACETYRTIYSFIPKNAVDPCIVEEGNFLALCPLPNGAWPDPDSKMTGTNTRTGVTLIYPRPCVECLFELSEAGDVEADECLLSLGADIHSYYESIPLYEAASNGHAAVVETLMKNAADVNKSIALCEAASNGHVAVVETLLKKGAEVNKCHKQSTPLYRAASNGHLAVVETLLNAGADVNKMSTGENWMTLNLDGRLEDPETPLHGAASNGHAAVVETLLKAGANANGMLDGFTPLHLAIRAGNTECVKKLLLSQEVDVNIKDKEGNTPLMLARENYEILKLLRTVYQFPVHTFGKVILCGNSGAGKSTLAHAIMNIFNCNEEVGSISHRIKNLYKAVEPPKPLTAGIIPYDIQGPQINMVLYDLAGQPEYYTSHCACLEAISLSSPVTFLLLVDLNQELKDIIQQLHYWSTMICSVCAECPHPSEVIIVGTHADNKAKRNVLQSKSYAIEDLAKTVLKHQHFSGFIALDATNRFSQDMKKFIEQLRQSNDKMIQQSPAISTDCHILYAFLQQMVPSKQIITISHLLSMLQADETNVLPTETHKMAPLATALSAKGLILFIPNKCNIGESWIVLQKSMLLQRVAGVLFSPDTFQEYHALASNIGLVPISHIAGCFPDLAVHMLVEFVSQHKLCHIVDNTLKIISPSETPFDWANSSSGYSLFFPSLVRESKPDSIAINAKGSFGWLMRTQEEHQFFDNRFLHILMLTLMNSCRGVQILCNPALQNLNRQCTVWSTGICWNSDRGVTTLVELQEQFRSLCVAVSFPGPQYQELTVLQTIRETVKQYCSSIKVEEFIINPHQISALFHKDTVPISLSCVEISKLKNFIMEEEKSFCDVHDNVVFLADWINAEPRLPKLIGIELNNYESDVEPQLKDLMNEIGAKIPAKWRAVGIQLSIPTGILDDIQTQNAGKPYSCLENFEQVFTEWKNMSPKIPYTSAYIIDILRQPAVGQNDLAETLAKKFTKSIRKQ